MSDHYEIAIIGAGIAGASIAAETVASRSVVMLEAEDRPGYHATGRSAAFWEESYGGPLVQPLTTASRSYLEDHGFLGNREALIIARDGQEEQIDQLLAEFSGTGVRMDRQNRDELDRRVSGLRPEWTSAVWEPDCKDIDVAALHAHYLKLARSGGAELQCRFRLASAVRSGALWTLTSERGETVTADVLVNAAGAWVDQVAEMAGVRPIGVTPYRRTMVQLRTEPEMPDNTPLISDIAGEFYFKPEAGRIWLTPHDETPTEPCDTAPEEFDVALAIYRFEQVVDWKVLQVEHKWAGLRSFAPDRLPVYGWDGSVDGFFWFAGQGGFGIQTAPAAARLAAQQLLGREADAMTRGLDGDRYSPKRFG